MTGWLRSLAYTIVFYSISVVIVVVALPLGLLPKRVLQEYTRGWGAFHDWCVRWLLGIRVVIIGTPPEGQVLVAAKHQSAWETIALVRLLDRPTIVLKEELARIPLWGWLARKHGMIPIDRAGSSRTLRALLRAADEARAAGRPVLIFPEGTRVAPGDSPPLRAGFAGLYRHLKVPVVPVSMDAGKLWRKGRFVKSSGVITLRFEDAIPPGLPRAEAEALVHAAINRDPAASDSLTAPAQRLCGTPHGEA